MREIGGERDRDAERKKKRRKKNRKKNRHVSDRQTDRQTKTEADSTPAEMLLTVYEHKDEDNALRTDISEHLQQLSLRQNTVFHKRDQSDPNSTTKCVSKQTV